MSLVLNIYVQVLPLREDFDAFILSMFASKTKQSAGVRLSEETLTCPMERCVSITQTKKRAEIGTFLPLQSPQISHSLWNSAHFTENRGNRFECQNFRHFGNAKICIGFSDNFSAGADLQL